MKKCNKCGVIKSLSQFHKQKNTPDNHNYYCKDCCRDRLKEWRNNNRERFNKSQVEYNHRTMSIWINRLKFNCRQVTKTAIRIGRLERKPCEVCGEVKTDAHHDYYGNPFSVRWLCKLHHAQVHKVKKEYTEEEIKKITADYRKAIAESLKLRYDLQYQRFNS